MDDLDRYIQDRRRRDPAFKRLYDIFHHRRPRWVVLTCWGSSCITTKYYTARAAKAAMLPGEELRRDGVRQRYSPGWRLKEDCLDDEEGSEA